MTPPSTLPSFISLHTLQTPSSFSSRFSPFHSAHSIHRPSVRTYPYRLPPFSSNEPAPAPPPQKPIPEIPYNAWRNPTWLRTLPPTLSTPSSSPPPPFLRIPSEYPLFKLAISVTLLSILSLFFFLYYRLNSLTYRLLSNSVHQGLSREITVGRVVRCNPLTGLKIKNVHVLPSAARPTAPILSANQVAVSFSGHWRTLFLRRPLKVDVKLDGVVVTVSQTVVQGAKGLPIGQWDHGMEFKGGGEGGGLETLFRYLQPGTLTVRNADVLLRPAAFLEYGHLDEVVEIGGANAEMTFPEFRIGEGGRVEMDGQFKAGVKGVPVEGGSIEVEFGLDGAGFWQLKPEDPVVTLRVVGEGIKARSVASFLSLPFRADEGVCAADIGMEFLFKSKSLVPIMTGEAKLEGVGLRFHPDPKTPKFEGIDGKLRLEGKTLFLDGPVGVLGTLPMAVVGSIHLEEGYQLMGYVRRVEVNEILETFAVEKFVPVEGMVEGEVEMSGILEEPIVTGWAQTVTENNVFDRLPVKNANVVFEWDAIAGTLTFSEIHAAVKGGGAVTGSGGLYFDMTKESPYGISRKVHCPRSPKAAYWNPDSHSGTTALLRPLPEDDLEIDEQAPFRLYDSMRFDFKVEDVNGGDLLYHYGGMYGQMATKALGLVSGEAVLAGHAKDANCRAVWRSTTPPPPVQLHSKLIGKGDLAEKDISDGSNNKNTVGEEQIATMIKSGQGNETLLRDKSQVKNLDEDGEANDMLGGGDFKGLVYIKLGDLPDSRRIKARTTVANFDARRAGWSDPKLRAVLANAPLLKVSVDTYFTGTTAQRPILPPGALDAPRTPRMELLGADGALAVKNLTINNVRFDKVMSGSFSFTISDFLLSLKEVKKSKAEAVGQKLGYQQAGEEEEVYDLDELTVAASLKGEGTLCFHMKDSEIVASVTKNEQNRQVASVLTRNIIIEDFLGDDRYFSSGETLGGVLNMDMNLDITSRRGNGNLTLLRPHVGPMNFASVVGNLVWRDQDLILEGGVVKYRQSEYQINAKYKSSGQRNPEFEWEVNVNIPRASIGDVASLVQSGNAVATAMQSPGDKISTGRLKYSGGPVWIRKLSESSGLHARTAIGQWQVPEHLSFEEQMKWFNQYLEDKENIKKLSRSKILEQAFLDDTPTEIKGDISGRVTVKYNSQSGETRRGPSNASAVLQAILDQLTRTTFSFQLGGSDWRFGPALLDRVEASGKFEDGVLLVGPLSMTGRDGFAAEAQGRITSAGSVKGSAVLRKAPAALVNQFSKAPVDVTGECNGRVEVEGNLSNPRAFGRAVWTDATLNGEQVHGAKTDMACVNGRCILNVNARIGGRQKALREESDEAGIRSLQWGKSVISGLKDLALQVASKAEAPKLVRSKAERRGSGEAMRVRVSAPVRFYLLNYLQRRAPTSFWSAVEPLLGGSLRLDDEWVLMDVDVKKYGLILLNTVLPDLGWERGDSDISLRVSGTLADPVVKGVVSVSDGRASPSVLADSMQGLRGEIEFSEKGLVSLKSISGRCSGKSVNVNGDLFFSEKHHERLSAEVFGTETVLERLKPKDASGKRERRQLTQRLSEVKTVLQRGEKGISVEFGEVGVNVQDVVVSNVSGKLQITGTSVSPVISGGVTFTEGVVSLGNISEMANGASEGGGGMVRLSGNVGGVEDAALAEILSSKSGGESDAEPGAGEGQSEEVDEGDAKKKTTEKKEDGETTVKPIEVRKLSDGFGELRLDKLRVTLGRDMQVVQPFVLNLETQGSILVDGTGADIDVEGEVRVVRGSINMLTTRMSVRRDARNYIRFVKKAEGGDPLLNMTLEDSDVIVKIGECVTSRWADHLVVADKRGDEWSEKKWEEVVESNLGNIITSKEKMAKVLAGYVVKSVSGGGRVGKMEWRVFPALVSRSGGFVEGKLTDELGVGGEFEWGGITIGGKRALDGSVGGDLKVGGKWGGVELEMEGDRMSSLVEIRLPKWFKGSKGKSPKDLLPQEQGIEKEAKP